MSASTMTAVTKRTRTRAVAPVGTTAEGGPSHDEEAGPSAGGQARLRSSAKSDAVV